MEKDADIKPTAELSPEMIKTICDAISHSESNYLEWLVNEKGEPELYKGPYSWLS